MAPDLGPGPSAIRESRPGLAVWSAPRPTRPGHSRSTSHASSRPDARTTVGQRWARRQLTGPLGTLRGGSAWRTVEDVEGHGCGEGEVGITRNSARLVRQTRTIWIFKVRGPQGLRGHLKISGGGLVWWPRSTKRTSYRQSWRGLETAAQGLQSWSRRKGRSDPR